jgi:DNA-directed RNA polymerase sigma subunit (sigma70/sigma32)
MPDLFADYYGESVQELSDAPAQARVRIAEIEAKALRKLRQIKPAENRTASAEDAE